VIQILNNLDSNVLFDLSKTYAVQKKFITKRLLPTVKSAINPSLEAYDTEILQIIKQLHKSYREIWKLDNEERRTARAKLQHIASRRDQV